MSTRFIVFAFFLFSLTINAQNGTYNCTRQEYKELNEEENKEYFNKCTITIQIYGVGGNDIVTAEVKSKNPNETRTDKWYIKSELRMSPDAKVKNIFKSYWASLTPDGEADYQISIIKGKNSGYISLAAIDKDGATWWFYDLDKIK